MPAFLDEPHLQEWNGTNWTVSYDQPTGQEELPTGSISCPTATFCMEATGSSIRSWSAGTWLPVPSSFPGNADSISCTSASSCVAVGIYRIGSSATNHNLAEVWNGKSWRPTTTQAPGSAMGDVSCAGSGQCVAVGGTDDFLTMAQRWNGTRWTLLKTINP